MTGGLFGRRWPVAMAAVGLLLAAAVGVERGAVAGALDTTTTTSTSTTSTTSTTTSWSTSTTSRSTSTTGEDTTTSSTGASTSTTAADDASETGVGSGFGPEQPFNPASRLVLPDAVARAAHDLVDADAALATARRRLTDASASLAAYGSDLGGLETTTRQTVERAVAAKQRLVDRAVALYMGGGGSASLALLGSAQPDEIDIGMTMLDSVLDSAGDLARVAESASDDVHGALRKELDRGVRLTDAVTDAKSDLQRAELVDQAAHWQLEAYRDGSHVWIPGFIFPVAGPTHFVDSFGDSRLAGTKQQHWHAGCDVLASSGTPLVAVEDGVLTRYGGGDPLGGLSLTLKGASGYSYYYAHLSRFVDSLHQGDLVHAGEVVGYVGQTGDAVAPHLHFEIHEPGGLVLDSFGLLEAAWSARQQALHLPGGSPTDPVDPPPDPPGASLTKADTGAAGGFPRYPDGEPVEVEATLPTPPPD